MKNLNKFTKLKLLYLLLSSDGIRIVDLIDI